MTPARSATFRRKLKRQASAVEPFFTDSFVGGVRNNANGFVWGGGTYVTVSADRAYTGSHSLKFTFTPGVESLASWSEQRFDLGRYVNEFAIDYQLYIPSNFTHRDAPPGQTENNKFFMLWRDTYSDVPGGTQQVGFEYWREGDGDSNVRSMCRMTNASPGEQLISDFVADEFRPTLISPTGPLFKGQWNRIRIAVKGSSARGVSDGYLKLWIGDTLFRNYTSAAIWNAYTSPSDVVFRNGYLLGYVNSDVETVQEWFVDDVKVYDTNPGWENAPALLARFTATAHSETSGNLNRWTQNGVEGYNRAWVQRAAFDGATPSGTHAYRMRYGDSVGNVPGGAPNGIAEFGLVFPADYGPEAFIEWKLFIPDGTDGNGPALNFDYGGGGNQVKFIRIWPLKTGESMSADGGESYAQGANRGSSEFGGSGLVHVYGYRDWNGGAPSSWSGGGDPYFVTPQHPASGARDSVFLNPANLGRWVTIRCRYKMDVTEVTDGTSPGNGIAQTWVDGVLLNGSGTDFRDYPGPSFSRDWRYAYLMGPRDITSMPNDAMWIDDVRVYKGGFV